MMSELISSLILDWFVTHFSDPPLCNTTHLISFNQIPPSVNCHCTHTGLNGIKLILMHINAGLVCFQIYCVVDTLSLWSWACLGVL